MNANQFYDHLKDKQFREASQLLWQGWQEMRWEIRGAIIGSLVGLLLLWIVAAMGWLVALLAAPLGICALIAVARPVPALGGVDTFVSWADGRQQRASAKSTFFAKWVARPFYAGLSGSANLTSAIKDPYLRAGTTVTVQSYAVYLALAVFSAAVYVMLVLLCIAIGLWILSFALSGSSGGGSTVRWVSPARSEEREDFFGNPYTRHLDDEGNPAGRTETREDFFGRPYQQHLTAEGDLAGHSEQREGLFGNRYAQHYDEQGAAAGHSERREDFLGREYIQHFNEEGDSAGRSEEREDFLGRKYTQHTEE